MKKYYLAFLMLFTLSLGAQAQGQYIQDISGSPIAERKLSELTGSPYLYPDFVKGEIKVGDKEYKDLFLRLDLIDDKLSYKKELSSEPLEPTDKVSSFRISTPEGNIHEFKYLSFDKPVMSGFYQVLENGSTTLLKRTKKGILESVAYNSASTEKSVTTEVNYFLQKGNGELQPVKKDQKDFLNKLGDKKEQLITYIKAKKVNFKDDSSLSSFIKYYNSL